MPEGSVPSSKFYKWRPNRKWPRTSSKSHVSTPGGLMIWFRRPIFWKHLLNVYYLGEELRTAQVTRPTPSKAVQPPPKPCPCLEHLLTNTVFSPRGFYKTVVASLSHFQRLLTSSFSWTSGAQPAYSLISCSLSEHPSPTPLPLGNGSHAGFCVTQDSYW